MIVKYYSSYSKSAILDKMSRHTKKALLIGNTGSKQITLWRKGGYFELTWPAFAMQPSFCGVLREEGERTAIIGRFMPGHYLRLQQAALSIAAPVVAYWVSGSWVPAALSMLMIVTVSMVYLLLSPEIGVRGNRIVEDFITGELL